MATLDLGKIKQVWRGTYNNSTAYVVDDLVSFTDSGITSTYICVANSTGNNPSSSGTAHASWNYVAKGVVDPIPSQSGNSGKVLKTDGSSLSFADAESGLQSIQVFDTSGSHTWTKPTGIKKVKVIVTGGGGGGFGYRVGNDQAPSTGGAGGTAIELIDVSSVSTVSVTVGTGGAGAEGNNGAGSNGGTSSFGSYCSATGGEGGSQGDNDYRSGGIGGVGTGGNLNLTGGSGTSGGYSTADNPNPTSTLAGSSFWGGAGGSMAGATHGGKTATRIDGKNGGGGGGTAASTSAVGGDGGIGVVYVEEFK